MMFNLSTTYLIKRYFISIMKQLKRLVMQQLKIIKLEKETKRLRMIEAENFVIKASYHELEQQNCEFTHRWIQCRDELKILKELHNA